MDDAVKGNGYTFRGRNCQSELFFLPPPPPPPPHTHTILKKVQVLKERTVEVKSKRP